MPVVPSINAT
ncbi:hypothetical protein FG05_35307 [Fusarium graminearum]|nr:hypothetical protein FG05_35307 [Fusarium graminearum]